MQNDHLREMSVEDLWNLYEKFAAELARTRPLEKKRLEERRPRISSDSRIVTERA
jgi:hypothetical protein